MCASSDCRATALRVPSAWASVAVPIATSRPKSRHEGIFLEQLETDPARYLPAPCRRGRPRPCRIDLEPAHGQHPGTLDPLSGCHPAAAHRQNRCGPGYRPCQIKERLDQGEDLPQYFKDHIIYYAGPAKTPPGMLPGLSAPPRPAAWIPMYPFSGPGRVHGHAGQGKPVRSGHRCL